MSGTFNSSTSLRRPVPHAAQVAAAAAAAAASSSTSSSPAMGLGIDATARTASRWWTQKFGLGSASERSLAGVNPSKAKAGCPGKAKFATTGGAAAVGELSFGPPAMKGAGPLAVACGPRVGLFGNGGGGMGAPSELDRALKPDAKRKRNEESDSEEDDDVDANADNGLDSVKADRNLPTGGALSHCAAFRGDGRLVAVGTEGGGVRVCDARSRVTLRTFGNPSNNSADSDRSRAVRSAAWLRDGKRLVAGGDDGVVRVWNLGRSEPELELVGHGDAVRAVALLSIPKEGGDGKQTSHSQKQGQTTVGTAWDQLAASGSYDHTIRIWEIPSPGSDGGINSGDERCLAVMDHGYPVEALLVVPAEDMQQRPNHPLLVSAGGTVLKIWNPLSGKCLGTVQTRHAKTITSLCLLDIPEFDADDDDNDADGQPRRRRRRQILTAGLDGLLRIHSASNLLTGHLPCICGFRLTSDPVTSLALSRDCSRLAYGTTTGTIVVHQRNAILESGAAAMAHDIKKQHANMSKGKRKALGGSYSHFMRTGGGGVVGNDDVVLVRDKKRKLAPYDIFLRKFQYGDALDAALATRTPDAVAAVVEELGKRRGLTIALSNRDEEGLEQILAFTVRYISSPRFASLLIGVAHVLCDVYGNVLGQSALVDELFAKLKLKVGEELGAQKVLLKLLGQIDSVMGAAEVQCAEEGGAMRS